MWLGLQQVSGYHPHGYCYLWQTDLVWLHAGSDALIALAYYSIPLGLVYFVRQRRDLPFNWMFVAFAAFILACGTTHLMNIWTLWHPDFWAAGWVKAATAGASLATAALLVPLVPRALRLPSPRDLAEKNRELEAFSYTVSHDLRAPLRAMSGFAAALLEDYGDRLDVEGRGYAERIVGASERMDRLIEDLIDYSQVARKELQPQTVELETVVDEAMDALRSGLERTGAEVVVERPMPRVRAHPGVLRRVVANLLGNAAKFVPPGDPPRIRVRADVLGSTVRVWVEDNGIGIAPEHHERIFDVFERLHGREQYDGTGVGLGVVRKGVERMGGRVGVESTPGTGSRFWIELPRETG